MTIIINYNFEVMLNLLLLKNIKYKNMIIYQEQIIVNIRGAQPFV